MYDTNQSTGLENSEVAAAQIDAYKAIGRVYVPTQFDIAGYGSVLDANADGKITLTDLEKVCERYIGMWAAMNPQTVQRETVKNSARVEMTKSIFRKQFGFIRRLFDKYDGDKSGAIGAEEVKPLMEDTYKIMGINRTFGEDDVRSFMGMMDKDINGTISYEEYEDSLIKSLNRRGINLTD
jgi:Ca2+-binding EF-hand superfamily protein